MHVQSDNYIKIIIMKKHAITLFIISLCGVLFAGYLAGVKVFNKECALDTSCSYFLGLPTCIYGFVMFTILLIGSSVLLFHKKKTCQTKILKVIFSVAIIGSLFSLYFATVEIMGGVTSALILPTCAYGLIAYVIIFVVSGHALFKSDKGIEMDTQE